VRDDLVAAVVDRLGVGRVRADFDGLARVYAAWCRAVPFDNARKLVHLASGRGGPLPGSTADDFFDAWLATRAGGTCWSGNGALYALLEALGFAVERGAATMMTAPDTPPSNHGTVVATIDGVRWVVDASILTEVPLALDADDRDPAVLPRIEQRDGGATIVWRTARSPDGFACRIDRVGVGDADWDALHQRTAAWGPFNYAAVARVVRGGGVVGCLMGSTYAFDAAGRLTMTPAPDRDARDRFLIDAIGIDRALVARLPDDRELPPRPA
jgi:N-hydroxyarylamine O-acetyltransferase